MTYTYIRASIENRKTLLQMARITFYIEQTFGQNSQKTFHEVPWRLLLEILKGPNWSSDYNILRCSIKSEQWMHKRHWKKNDKLLFISHLNVYILLQK